MNKILVIGSPGAGKSVFSRELRDKLNIPLFYMDCLFWRENWTHVTNEELDQELNEIFKLDKYIIDGNFSRTLEMRFKEADTIFFLDISVDICLESEKIRRGTKREDLPEYLEEKYDPEFIEYIKNFKNDGRINILNLMNKYQDKKYYVFKSREEKYEFLNNLK